MLKNCLKVIKRPFSSYSKQMLKLWKQNPFKVHSEWNDYFSSQNVQSLSNKNTQSVILNTNQQKQKDLALKAYLLIRYYKTNGHEIADLDPLKLEDFAEFGKILTKHKLQATLTKNKIILKQDLDVPFQFPTSEQIIKKIAIFLKQKETWTLRQIKFRLQNIYCRKLGAQFMHINSCEQKQWLMAELQKIPQTNFSHECKKKIMDQLTKIEAFNSFLFSKIKTSKRFGVEGLDSMISGINHLVQEAAAKDIKFIGFGMAHRGRVNTLVNVFQKPLQRVFAEYQEKMIHKTQWGLSGDVNYHLGSATTRQINGKKIRLSILPNPSHLETVNAVAMGHVKAFRDSFQNQSINSLCVIIHGDAAIAGQGVTYEALQTSYLQHYDVKGVIHVVANNQIGFTTTPSEARTGLYCTDVAKTIQAPVFHVNADEPELVHKMMAIALEYREKFHKDIFIDIIGYRRYGHNELDQPVFTQPMMYQKIAARPNIYTLYSQKLIDQAIITNQYLQKSWQTQINKLNSAYGQAIHESFDVNKLFFQNYHKFPVFSQLTSIKKTQITKEILAQIGSQITKFPTYFEMHPQIVKIYDARKQSISLGKGIDYGTAEALAFGSLIKDGFKIRLSGQDVQRATFSHRHAVLVDQKTQTKSIPLKNLLSPNQKNRIQIQNSPLSEYGALAFQYGYSLTNLNTLTIWEAQFGDFANGAQIMIDDYITSGQNKWNIQSGIVLNLPHGMDGQGPEHSSCRIQRFLQLVNDGWSNLNKSTAFIDINTKMRICNIQVACCSTAANLYHIYRRQLIREYRKPLINVINKKLLKNRDALSNLDQIANGQFQTFIGQNDQSIIPNQVKKVIITYGQAYYAAINKRRELNAKDTAIVRIQQLAPFDYKKFINIIKTYPKTQNFIWFQEQHKNYGPWTYIGPRISLALNWLKEDTIIKTSELKLCSRKASASPAVGKKKIHDQQQSQLLSQLFEQSLRQSL